MTQQSLFDNVLRNLDPDIRFLAEKGELGELRKVYHASKRYTATRMGGWLIVISGIGYLLYAIFIILMLPPHPFLVWTLPGLLLVVIGCAMILPRRIYAHWHVYLYESGFLYEKGQVCQVFRWDHIEQIQGSGGYSPQHGRTFINYKVRRQDDYEVKLNNTFLDIAQFIDILLEAFSRQAATQELSMVPPRDKTFAYQFKLDRQGISDTQGALLWEDIQELTIENGTMAVLKR